MTVDCMMMVRGETGDDVFARPGLPCVVGKGFVDPAALAERLTGRHNNSTSDGDNNALDVRFFAFRSLLTAER